MPTIFIDKAHSFITSLFDELNLGRKRLSEEEGLSPVYQSGTALMGNLSTRITLYEDFFVYGGHSSYYDTITEIICQKRSQTCIVTVKYKNQTPFFRTFEVGDHALMDTYIEYMVSMNPKIHVGTI